MFSTIIAAVFVIVAVLALAMRGYFKTEAKRLQADADAVDTHSYNGRDQKERLEKKADENLGAATGSLAAFGVFLGIAAIIMAFATTVVIEAKQVGVVTTFGKVADETLDPGLHFKKPWDKVSEIDTTIQTSEYHGKSAIEVRAKGSRRAYVSATIRWSVNPETANGVYADFRNSDDITDAFRKTVVSTQFKAATDTAFKTFDPMEEATVDGEALDKTAYEEKIREILLERTNDRLNADDLTITISMIRYDERTEKAISALQAEYEKTRQAQQAQKTAAEQAKANEILSESISKDPNVLVARCLDLIESGDLKLAAGTSCWPNGGTGVVIPGGR